MRDNQGSEDARTVTAQITDANDAGRIEIAAPLPIDVIAVGGSDGDIRLSAVRQSALNEHERLGQIVVESIEQTKLIGKTDGRVRAGDRQAKERERLGKINTLRL
jgi:hypothetical protein